ncbi:hypothetical protein HYFRA_00005301 [Hymenoscyphus fraxineus]|uniref:Integral membrane protein n=1 Tax=Hymenoscyphus fraxineus TaxID=746836 RepID=A0A9N9LF22_9HELO|nr:hypothetical protein HYFRA_00005301 [Hymenoscyphus fraxineus]
MDISAPLQTSYLQTTVYNPSYNPQRQPGLPTSRLPNGHKKEKESKTSPIRTFTPVDWESYKAKCHEDRLSVSSFEVDEWQPVTQLTYSGPFNRFYRMATVYPTGDMGWRVATTLTFTQTCFAINSLFNLTSLTQPQGVFEGEKELVIPITLAIPMLTLPLGIFLGLVAAFNVDRGDIEEWEKKKQKLGFSVTARYKPAFVGSSNFVWFPAMEQLKKVYLPNTAFQAGLFQLLAALTFLISSIAQLPNVFPAGQIPAAVTGIPLFLGGSFFFGAAIVLQQRLQAKWYIPKFERLHWWAPWFGMMGGFWFMLVGISTLASPANRLPVLVFTTFARFSFLTAAFLGWFMLMEFYPD